MASRFYFDPVDGSGVGRVTSSQKQLHDLVRTLEVEKLHLRRATILPTDSTELLVLTRSVEDLQKQVAEANKKAEAQTAAAADAQAQAQALAQAGAAEDNLLVVIKADKEEITKLKAEAQTAKEEITKLKAEAQTADEAKVQTAADTEAAKNTLAAKVKELEADNANLQKIATKASRDATYRINLVHNAEAAKIRDAQARTAAEAQGKADEATAEAQRKAGEATAEAQRKADEQLKAAVQQATTEAQGKADEATAEAQRKADEATAEAQRKADEQLSAAVQQATTEALEFIGPANDTTDDRIAQLVEAAEKAALGKRADERKKNYEIAQLEAALHRALNPETYKSDEYNRDKSLYTALKGKKRRASSHSP